MDFSYDVEDEDEAPEQPFEKPFNYSAYPRINVRLIVLILLTILTSVVGLAILDAKNLLPVDIPFTIPNNMPQSVAVVFASPTATSTATPIPPTSTATPTATPIPTATPSENLGVLPGMPAGARYVSGLLDPADGDVKTLELTDAAGYTWRMEIPPEALFTRAYLRLVALDDIGNTSTLPSDSGIRLEPSGLFFLQPVRLTVKVPRAQAAENGVFLVGSAPGDDLRLAEIERGTQTGEYHTWIWKLETVVWSGADEDQIHLIYESEVLAEYERARQQVQNLVAPLPTPPIPPESAPTCLPAELQSAIAVDQNRWQVSSDYLSQVFGEDFQAIERLLGASATVEHLYLGSEVQDLTMARQLFERRAVPAIDYLVQTYASDPLIGESSIAAGLFLARLYQSVGGDPEQILAGLSSGLTARLKDLTQAIQDEHSFQFYPQVVLETGRWLSLANPALEPAVWQALVIDSMRFKVQVKYELKGTLPDGRRIEYFIQGQIPIQPAFAVQGITWQSSGELIYESGSFGNLKVAEGSNFPVKLRFLGFDDCQIIQFGLALDRLGAEQENYLLGNQQLPGQGQANLLSRTLFEPIGYYELSVPQFLFPIDLKMSSPVMEKQIKTQAGTLSAILSLRVIHEK